MSKGPDHIDYEETPDLNEVHAAIQREHRDPTAKVTPVPLWVTLLCGASVCWAGAYIGVFHGGFSSNIYNEYESSPAILFPQPARTAKKQEGAPVQESLVTIGKQVYSANCQACHQPTGLGTPGAIPPLAGSEWVQGSEKRVSMIVLKGLTGPVKVVGATFNSVMPPWEASLNDKKIAAVLTYVRQEWGNKGGEIAPEQIKAVRAEISGHKASFTEAELQQVPADAKIPGGAAPAGGGNPAPAAAPAAAPAPAGQPAPQAAAPQGAAPSAAPAPGGNPAFAQGQQNFNAICGVCHQPTGAGLPGAFPSLVQSEFVNGSPKRMAAMVLKGVNPPFNFKGATYAVPMPPQEAALDDAKIAGILSYVRGSFGNTAPPVSAELVAGVRKELSGRTAPWTQAELESWKDDAAPAH